MKHYKKIVCSNECTILLHFAQVCFRTAHIVVQGALNTTWRYPMGTRNGLIIQRGIPAQRKKKKIFMQNKTFSPTFLLSPHPKSNQEKVKYCTCPLMQFGEHDWFVGGADEVELWSAWGNEGELWEPVGGVGP